VEISGGICYRAIHSVELRDLRNDGIFPNRTPHTALQPTHYTPGAWER